MPSQDTTQLKEKILQTLRRRGPSLPVHIANETGLSILFASAFLSELISDRKIKISYLRVGSSPIYFIPGQEPQLERYSHHLKSKEKDAYLLLKEKKFLEDSSQDPAIRVALRSIRDFAIGFQKSDKIFWRFFTIPESEFKQEKSEPETNEKTFQHSQQIPESLLTEVRQNLAEKPKETVVITEFSKEADKLIPPEKIEEKKDELDIFDEEEKPKPEKEKKKIAKKKTPVKKKTKDKKSDDKFFNRVKEFLNEKSIEIVDIEGFNKKDLVLRIKKQGNEELLFAYNKKRIEEIDIIKAAKKAEEENINYTLLSLGSPLKKIESLINAVRNLSSIERL